MIIHLLQTKHRMSLMNNRCTVVGKLFQNSLGALLNVDCKLFLMIDGIHLLTITSNRPKTSV